MDIQPIIAHRAVRIAFRDAKLALKRSDLELLACLYEAKKAVSFAFIVAEFNAQLKPTYNRWGDWFQRGLTRLVEKGLADLCFTTKGYRRWQITVSGRIEIDKINKAAIKILMDQAKEP